MPRPKKTAVAKSEDKATKTKKTKAPRAKKKPASKAKPVFVDVISDDLELAQPLASDLEENTAKPKEDRASLRDEADKLKVREEKYFPADQEEGGKFFDKQKNYYSDLIKEIGDKQEFEEKKDGVVYHKRRKSVPAYRKFVFKFLLLTAILLLVVGYFSFASLAIDIVPNSETISDSITLNIGATEQSSDSASSSEVMSGQVEKQDLEVERSYSSTGEEVLGEEVTGKVVLINNSGKAQPLVATTRLLSSDNKLFRLKDGVTIPAGQSIEAEIYADSVSSSMAIGPTKFTIPGLWVGLQDKIYAQSKEPFVYQHKVENYIKQSDLDYAYSNIRAVLTDKASSLGLSNDAVLSLNSDNTIIESASKLGDKTDNFTVKARNRVAIIHFDKNTVEKMIESKLQYVVPDDKEIRNFNKDAIVYSVESYDSETNTAEIKASFQAEVSLKSNASVLDKSKLVNLSEDQLNQYLKNIPAINSFKLSFRPSFLKKSPSLADRIKIRISD
jgi:hypothetical protein